MGFEQWTVLPADRIGDEDRFMLQFMDMPSPRTPPYSQTIGPMTEAELRHELRKLDATDAQADAVIAAAKAEIARGPNP